MFKHFCSEIFIPIIACYKLENPAKEYTLLEEISNHPANPDLKIALEIVNNKQMNV